MFESVPNDGDAMKLNWRLSDDPIDEESSDDYKDPEYRKGVKRKIFLGCLPNLISSAVRETIRFLLEYKMGTLWTPSKVIARLGNEIDHEDSIRYWAQKNSVPIYCPALSDGSLGDMIYFHNPGLVIDFGFLESASQLAV